VSGTPTVFAELGERVQREIPLLGAAALALIIGAYLLIPWTERRRHRLVPIACTLRRPKSHRCRSSYIAVFVDEPAEDEQGGRGD
jgi:hypothetical protein